MRKLNDILEFQVAQVRSYPVLSLFHDWNKEVSHLSDAKKSSGT